MALKSRPSAVCMLLASVAAASISVPAFAQDAEPQDAGSARPVATDEIIVTAQKRAENLHDVPIAIQAVGGESLKSSGFTDLRDLKALVPSFQASNPGNAANVTFSIRGVGQRDVNSISEGTVASFIDGTYISFIGALGQPLYDLERIEVLKGPQGTLFGRNATGGLINTITKKPTDYLDGYVTAEISSYQGRKLEGAVGGPLSDKVSARLSLSYDKADGYLKNTSGPDLLAKENYSGRLQFKFEPTDTLTVNLSGRYWKAARVPGVGLSVSPQIIDGNGVIRSPENAAEYAAYCATLAGSPVPPDGAWQSGSCYAYQPDPLEGDYGKNTFFEETYYALTQTLDWEMSNAVTLTSITDYQHSKMDYSANLTAVENGVLYQIFTRPQRQFSEELRFSGDTGGALRWQAGLYYLNIYHDVQTNFIFPVNYSLAADSYAAFAQFDYNLTNELTLTLGGRLMYDTKHFISQAVDGAPDVFAGTVLYDGANLKSKDWNWSGRAVLTYKPNPDVTIYGGVNRGVKGGGFDGGGIPAYPASQAEYAPETLYSYEAGVKANIFGNLASIDTSVFYYDYYNYQAFSAANQTINTDAKILGAEMFLTVRPVHGLTLTGGGTYLDAKQKDVPLGNGTFSDFPMPQAPKWALQGSIRYATPLVGDDELALQFSAMYQDTATVSAIPAKDQSIPSYHRFDARASYKLPGGHLQIAGFINNITDEIYYLNRLDFTSFTGNTVNTPDRPRWGGVNVTYNF